MADSNSAAFTLNSKDLLNLGRNALLVGVAASLTYLGENATSINLGPTGVLIVPIVSLLIDAAVKWAKDNSKEQPKA